MDARDHTLQQQPAPVPASTPVGSLFVAPSAATIAPATRLPFDPIVPPPAEKTSLPAHGAAVTAAAYNLDSTPGSTVNMGELMKKKRGRPRKYAPDGSMALALSPTSNNSAASAGTGVPGSDPSVKRRGRPPGSGKKHQLLALGTAGLGFAPHVITVKPGEDVATKLMAFSQQGPRAVCVLSANGAICNVTLRQPAASSGLVTYEGRFEIISLAGSFLLLENSSTCSRTSGLSIALAGSDGRVLGGSVAGMLMAATPVQVVVGSFIAEGRKEKPLAALKHEPSSAPPHMTAGFITAPPHLTGFVPTTLTSPASEETSGESSDEDSASAVNHSGAACNSSIQHGPSSAYGSNMGWSFSAHQ